MYKRTIGVLGGSFDPPHIGHIELANFAKEYVDEVWVIPCGYRSDKPQMTRYDIRLSMCLAAFSGFRVDDIEKESSMIPTFTLIKSLENLYQEYKFYFIIGKDLLFGLSSWDFSEKLVNEVNFLVFNRPGYQINEEIAAKYLSKSNFVLTNNELNVNISSTEIRRIIQNWKNLEISKKEKKTFLCDLVKIEEVSEIILKNDIYFWNKT